MAGDGLMMMWPPVVFMQCDTAFYRQALAAIGSFLRHNPRWTVVIGDVGLTEEQVSQFRQFSTVIPGMHRDEYKDGRNAQGLARLQGLHWLLSRAGAVVLQLDADTVTLGSVGPWVSQMESAEASFSFYRERIPVGIQFSGTSLQNPGFLAAFPSYWDWRQRATYQFGVFLVKSSPVSQRVLSMAYWYLQQRREWFEWAEQAATNAVLYEAGVPVLEIGPAYNAALHVVGVIYKQRRPYLESGEPVVIMHYASYNYPRGLAEQGPVAALQYPTDIQRTRLGSIRANVEFWRRQEAELAREGWLSPEHLREVVAHA